MKSKQDKTFHVASFDLEAVLYTPCSEVSTLYYKRKLASYNLSVYAHNNGKGHCYMWDESHAKRGSCEIATCLLLYLRSLPKTVEDVTFYSDTCSGQNPQSEIHQPQVPGNGSYTDGVRLYACRHRIRKKEHTNVHTQWVAHGGPNGEKEKSLCGRSFGI